MHSRRRCHPSMSSPIVGLFLGVIIHSQVPTSNAFFSTSSVLSVSTTTLLPEQRRSSALGVGAARRAVGGGRGHVVSWSGSSPRSGLVNQGTVRRRNTSMCVWPPLRYAAVFTGGIALSTWVNARVNRRNERIRQHNLDSGLAKGGGPSPELFMQKVRSIHESAAIKTAVELQVFTKLGALGRKGQGIGGGGGGGGTEGGVGLGRTWTGATAEEMAQQCGCSRKGMRILLDTLAAGRFLRKRPSREGGPATYRLTTSSAKYLDEASETCVAQLADWYFSDAHVDPLLKHLTESVRQGGTAVPADLALKPDDPRWLGLAETFGPVEKATAAAVARIALEDLKESDSVSVLDVAVGHGMYGIEFARRHKGLTVTALGALDVMQKVAVPNAKKAGILEQSANPKQVNVSSKSSDSKKSFMKGAGVASSSSPPWGMSDVIGSSQNDANGRYQLLAGDAFGLESLGEGEYDVVIVPHFLHVMDETSMRVVLGKARKALKPDGRCLIVEVVPNEERTDSSTAFSIVMLANTPGGDAYTLSELQSACADAGFAATQGVPLPVPKRGRPGGGWLSTLLVAYPEKRKAALAQIPKVAEAEMAAVGQESNEKEDETVKAARDEEDHETWAYPMSLGDFFSIFEGIIRSSLPGGGPEL